MNDAALTIERSIRAVSDCMGLLRCHLPRKRGIQYSAAPEVTGSPAFAGDDTGEIGGRRRFHFTGNGIKTAARPLLALVLAVTAGPALAHSENGVAIDFWGGFTHPIFGPDHVIAMVAVGLWGAFLGDPAIWLLPVVFPLVMAIGGAFGVAGLPLPGVETGIAISAIMLGGMVALAARPPLWIAAVLVGAFAVFHGHAHGAELPVGADAVAFSIGFVVATGMLHLAGIAFGGLSHWPAGRIAVRAAGGVICLLGFAYLFTGLGFISLGKFI